MRTCLLCGKALPEDTVASRKYCIECAEKHEAELAKIRQLRNNQKRAERRAEQPVIQKPRRTLLPQDKAYCGKCMYAGRQSEDYLCNYLLMTGERRGCTAGKGCKKRIIKRHEDETQHTCERCGAPYTGGKRTHFCPDCRKEACRNNAYLAIAARGKKNGG